MLTLSLAASVISETAVLALYIFICLSLTRPAYSLPLRLSVYGGALLCSFGLILAVSLGVNVMTGLTLLPLFAYIPFSVCLYILTEGGLFETAAACSMAALAAVSVKLADKVMALIPNAISGMGSWGFLADSAVTVILALGAGLAVFKLLRGPFKTGLGAAENNRALLLIPAATLFLLIFINFNRAISPALRIMTLIMAVFYFAAVSRVFVYSAKAAEADENEKRLAKSLELQRKSFERLSESANAGRSYRHDMRHHLMVISRMAKQNNAEEIADYIKELNESAERAVPERYCQNPAVNAVLCEHMSRARKIGCRAEFKAAVPSELPFELPDVCIIFSNALENALNACEKCPQEKRYVELKAELSEELKLIISVKNSCADKVKLEKDGLPAAEKRTDGHGIGLRGVKKTAEKYNGFVYCVCENGEFHFYSEIFNTPGGGGKKKSGGARVGGVKLPKPLTAGITAIVCAVGLLNFSPATAAALSETLSVNIKTLTYGWGDNGLSIRYPEFNGEGYDELNQGVRDFIGEAEKVFREYTLQKYDGYTAVDGGYRVYINDKTYLSARFYGTLNAGGSAEFSRCVNIDKKSGKVLKLGDLFPEGRDYISEISAEVIKEMEFRNEYMGGHYFLPGGIWSEEECFKEISEEQEFYIEPYGRLVIVFDEYEVAAGNEGAPEFFMPEGVFLHDVLGEQ